MWPSCSKIFYEEKVADLEAKLAESNENIKLLEQDRVIICNTMDMYIEKVEQLQQQLADKEKEIEGLKIKLETANTERHEEWKTGKEWKWEWQKVNRQLAKKEEEIKQLNNRILLSQSQAPKEQILNILGSQCIQYNQDQDKIEFAEDKGE